MADESEVEILDIGDILIAEQTATAVSTISTLDDDGINTQYVIHSRLAGFCVADPNIQLDFMLSPNRARKYIKQLQRALREHDREQAKQNPPEPEV